MELGGGVRAHRSRAAFWAWLVLGAAACGGGGDGGSPTPAPAQFQISTIAHTGGSVSPAGATVTAGGVGVFTITPDEGHAIASVSGCGGTLSGSSFTTGAVHGPCTVTATFIRIKHDVAVAPSTGGALSPPHAQVDHGSTATFLVEPSHGFALVGISGCGGVLDGNVYATGAVTEACTITATFELIEYTVTSSAGPNGTLTPSGVTVNYGATVVFEAVAESGYLVDTVSGCGGTLSGTTFTTAPIVSDCEVSAAFRLPQVAGTLIVAAGSAIDSDVNDPLAPYAPNDTIQTAQPLPNPVTLGGYANVQGQGPPGPSFDFGDEFDVYRVGLLGGQYAVLEIASDDVADDLDLWLVDADLQIVDASLHPTARVEWVRVPPGADGVYFVVVEAFAGGSNYTLNISHAPAALEENGWRFTDEFVPGEAIVRLTPEAEKRSAAISAFVPQSVAAARAGEPLPRNMRLERGFEKTSADPRGVRRLGAHFENPDHAEKYTTLVWIKDLQRHAGVEAAKPNYLHELQAPFIPSDTHYRHQWHYPQIALPEAWTLSTGAGVIVAVIDSGVALDHPDLAGQLVGGYDFVLGVPGGDDPGTSPPPYGGSNFHGTHVAGTVAATTGNDLGVAGVAFDARVMPLRVCAPMCSAYAIEQALRYAARLPNDSGTVPPVAADVVNLSLGRGGPALPSEQALYHQLRDLGMIVVAAAGNSNTAAPGYPAAYEGVIAVGAVDMERVRAPYSNFGPWVDLVAPGGDTSRDLNADGFVDGVLSTYVDDRTGVRQYNYRFLQGTSMAAPHVAGVAALMRSVALGLTPDDFLNLIRSGAVTDDLGPAGRDDEYGYGQINAYKAVTAALDAAGAPVAPAPFLIATPNALNFDAGTSQLSVVLSNGGGGTLQLGAPTQDSGGWLFGSSQQVGETVVWTIMVDRAGLPEGAYEATITFPSDANTVQVRVFMQVATPLVDSVGLQYILLIDPDTIDTKYQAIGEDIGGGRIRYTLTDVAPGEYLLVSGSDSDNDGFICGRGESCGVYRSWGDLVPIVVDGEDLDFFEFIVGYGTQPAPAGVESLHQGFRRLGAGSPPADRDEPKALPRPGLLLAPREHLER